MLKNSFANFLANNFAATTRHQRIHIHCCSLEVREMEAWRKQFPQAYFGYTAQTRYPTPGQMKALKSIPSRRPLLETDTQHISTDRDMRYSTPAYIGEVASMVAKAHNQPVNHILELTRDNPLEVYGQ